MDVRPLAPGDWDAIIRLPGAPLHPLAGAAGFHAARFWERTRADVEGRLKSSTEAFAVAAWRGGNCAGVLAADLHPWETKFFQRRMGQILFARAADGAAARALLDALRAARPWDTTSVKRDAADALWVRALEEAGFRLMDTNVAYLCRLARTEEPEAPREGLAIGPLLPDEQAEMLAMTEAAFAGYPSRFLLDERLPAAPRARFYRVWAEGALREDTVLAARVDDRLAAYLTFRENPEFTALLGRPTGQMVLGAVGRGFEGLGLYQALQRAALQKLRDEKFPWAVTVTHLANAAVQHHLQRLGYGFLSAQHSFHFSREDRP